MFYHGGMTLGYLTPPGKKEKAIRVEMPVRQGRDEPADLDREREQELSRAFLTPWHLFY